MQEQEPRKRTCMERRRTLARKQKRPTSLWAVWKKWLKGEKRRLFRRSDFGAPLIKPFLHPGDQLRTDHSGQGENGHADKNLVGLESSAGHGDHETDAGCGGIQLADH